MPFPPHIAELLERFRVRADTKAALEDLYLAMGSETLEVFADLVDEGRPAEQMGPEDLLDVRSRCVIRYLTRVHPKWVAGDPTGTFWHPRAAEGRASGLAQPLGRMNSTGDAIASRVEAIVRGIVGPEQPVPHGILLFSKNGHFGGRAETVSFDVVPDLFADAVAIALAEGRQHTLPGSVGETSATVDAPGRLALLWEIQPNVLKPGEGRNSEISKIYRKHRNWHVTTLVAAIEWFRQNGFSIFSVKGVALKAAHEVNSAQPVPDEIVEFHDRTLSRVVSAMGGTLAEPVTAAARILESSLMNAGLRSRVMSEGIDSSISAINFQKLQ